MTRTWKVSLACSMVAELLAVVLASQASAGQTVQVQVVGGRHVTAEVADRTDGQHLWLAFRTRSTEVLRPIAWDDVISAKWNGESLNGKDFRESALTSSPADISNADPVDDTPAELPNPPSKGDRTFANEALDLLFSPAKAQRD